MISALRREGWQVDKNLPTGWLTKRVQHTIMFMTSEFDALRTQKKALAYMEENNYDPIIIEKAKASFGNKTSTTADLQADKPSSDRPVIKQEKADNSINSDNKENIRVKIKSEVIAESDEKDPSLPPNWSIKTSKDGRETTITSNQGKNIQLKIGCSAVSGQY